MLTEIIELPSKGNLYPKSHPLSSGVVEIKYMTAREEDILTTESYIEKGLVLQKLLDAVIVTEGVSSNDLLTGDKQMVLLQTRILGYGSSYSFTQDGKSHTIDLSAIGTKGNPDLFNNSPLIQYELPKSGKTVILKILNGDESRELSDDIESVKSKGLPIGEVTTRLTRIIQSLDGVTDKKVIKDFVHNEMLAVDSLGVRMFLDIVAPDIDLTLTIDGEEVDIPIGVNFFYPTS